jgi:hypothetical protein
MYVVIFSTLDQLWLVRSIQRSWRSRLETATGGSLLPWAAPLLLPFAMRWESLGATTLLLLPHARRRLHPVTPLWRCGRSLISSSDTPGGAFIWRLPLSRLRLQQWMPPHQRGELIWTASRFQLFSIITKCIHSFSDSKVRKNGFSKERTSASKEGQPSTGSIYPW